MNTEYGVSTPSNHTIAEILSTTDAEFGIPTADRARMRDYISALYLDVAIRVITSDYSPSHMVDLMPCAVPGAYPDGWLMGMYRNAVKTLCIDLAYDLEDGDFELTDHPLCRIVSPMVNNDIPVPFGDASSAFQSMLFEFFSGRNDHNHMVRTVHQEFADVDWTTRTKIIKAIIKALTNAQ